MDFGSAFGVKSLYLTSRTADPATVGVLRLARTDLVSWRNNANSANLSLSVDASDNLLFNGISIGAIASVTDTDSIDLTLTGTALSADLNLSAAAADAGSTIVNLDVQADGVRAQVANAAIQGVISVTDTSTIDLTYAAGAISADIVAGSITNAMVNAAAAIAYSKLNLSASIVNADVSGSAAIAYGKLSLNDAIVNADINTAAGIAYSKLASLTANRALVSDGSGIVSVSAVTATELGYVSGVTSSIQTQLNSALLNPMTTGGDIIYGGASGIATRLANGTNGQVLTSSGGTSAPTWATPTQAATQANQETGTSTTTFVSPGRQQFHPSAAKAWVKFAWVAGVPTVSASYNVSSLTDTGVGETSVNFTVPFSSGNYAMAFAFTTLSFATQQQMDTVTANNTGSSATIRYANNGSVADNTAGLYACYFGDQ